MKRLFIAVPIGKRSRNEIFQHILQDESARRMPVRWTAAGNLHLTLQFLGDVEEKRIPVLKQILNRIPLHKQTEELRFTEIGAFPNLSAPRIIWLGIEKNPSLLNIQKRLTEDLARNDFSIDTKRFKAHLTLGRVREGAAVDAAKMEYLAEIASKSPVSASLFDRVTLFESQLRPGGSIYTALYDKILLPKDSL